MKKIKLKIGEYFMIFENDLNRVSGSKFKSNALPCKRNKFLLPRKFNSKIQQYKGGFE